MIEEKNVETGSTENNTDPNTENITSPEVYNTAAVDTVLVIDDQPTAEDYARLQIFKEEIGLGLLSFGKDKGQLVALDGKQREVFYTNNQDGSITISKPGQNAPYEETFTDQVEAIKTFVEKTQCTNN